MPTTINADTSTGGAIITGDTSGVLQLQSGGITAVTLTGANLTTAGNLTVTGALNSTTGLTSPALIAGGASGAQIRLGEATANGTNYAAIKAPDNLASNLTLTLPTADGTSGQFLQTNGSGQLAFATPASGTQAFTSSGSITAGQAVALNTDGTVSTITGTSTSQAVVATNSVGYADAVTTLFSDAFYDAENNWTVFIQADTSSQIFAASYRVAANGSVTGGAGVYLGTFSSSGAVVTCSIVKTGTNRYVAIYRSDSSTGILRGLTINPTTGAVSYPWGGSVSISNSNAPLAGTYDATSGRLLVASKATSSRVDLYAFDPATGSQTAFLSVTVPTSSGNGTVAIASNTAVAGQFLVLCAQESSNSQMISFTGTINSAGTTFTTGSQINSVNAFQINTNFVSLTYVSSINRYLLMYSPGVFSNNPYIYMIGASGGAEITSTAFSFPDSRQVLRVNSNSIDVTNSELRFIAANSTTGSGLQYGKLSFTASSFGSPSYSSTFPATNSYNTGSALYVPTATSSLLSAYARRSDGLYQAIAFTTESFSSNAQNFVGFATNTVTTGQSVTVAVPGGIATSQTGLTRNQEYYLNFNGSLVTTPTPFGVVLRATSTTEGGVIRPVNALRPLGNTSVTSGTSMSLPLGSAGFQSVQCNYTISLASAGTASFIVTLSDGQTVTLSFVGLIVNTSNVASNTTWTGLGPTTSSTYSGSFNADRLRGGVFTGRYDGNSFSGQINPSGFSSSASITRVTISTSAPMTAGAMVLSGVPA